MEFPVSVTVQVSPGTRLVTAQVVLCGLPSYVQDVSPHWRITVLGLIAAAALLLATPANFGSLSQSPLQFYLSLAIFGIVFLLSLKKKVNPILLILLSGVVGFLVYGI